MYSQPQLSILINVVEFTGPKRATNNRYAIREIRERSLHYLSGGYKVYIHFQGVEMISEQFISNTIGELYRQLPEELVNENLRLYCQYRHSEMIFEYAPVNIVRWPK